MRASDEAVLSRVAYEPALPSRVHRQDNVYFWHNPEPAGWPGSEKLIKCDLCVHTREIRRNKMGATDFAAQHSSPSKPAITPVPFANQAVIECRLCWLANPEGYRGVRQRMPNYRLFMKDGFAYSLINIQSRSRITSAWGEIELAAASSWCQRWVEGTSSGRPGADVPHPLRPCKLYGSTVATVADATAAYSINYFSKLQSWILILYPLPSRAHSPWAAAFPETLLIIALQLNKHHLGSTRTCSCVGL